ncbi:UDP-glucuronosyltransferase 1A1-like [Eublepharis macularius]|uniref:glucuronosyltransferase n=1 Tax=Eublepharis macularius TaxID=481883 RepID=A0AA97LF90_EUBMA|nr:UDP-glucuronosyltransferase 1A1-like [Eublepharis macularius]
MLPTFCSQRGHATALLLFLASLHITSCGKLLVVPMDGSHWLSMQSVLKQLKENGHEIVTVAPEVNLHIKPSDDLYTLKICPVPFTQAELEEHFRHFINGIFDELSFLVMVVERYKAIRKTLEMLFSTCTSLIYNEELMRYIEQSKFDALFTDPMMPCGQIVAEYLGIPSVFFLLQGTSCGLDSEALQCPSPPSYVPRILTTNTDHMTFAQHVNNLLMYVSEFFLYGFLYSPYSSLATEFLQKDITVVELLSHASLWLTRADFTFDYPKLLMPNVVAIGGINCAGGKSLTQLA